MDTSDLAKLETDELLDLRDGIQAILDEQATKMVRQLHAIRERLDRAKPSPHNPNP